MLFGQNVHIIFQIRYRLLCHYSKEHKAHSKKNKLGLRKTDIFLWLNLMKKWNHSTNNNNELLFIKLWSKQHSKLWISLWNLKWNEASNAEGMQLIAVLKYFSFLTPDIPSKTMPDLASDDGLFNWLFLRIFISYFDASLATKSWRTL